MRNFKTELFKALSHPARIGILDALRRGEMTVGDLQDALGLEQSNVSQHLAALRGRDLVSARREGSSIWYNVTDHDIWKLLDVARSIYERQVRRSHRMLERSI